MPTYKIWDFPPFNVKSQLFYTAGQAYDAGFTSGGARIVSPEPGGRSFLELELSLQVDEWTYPLISWIMSKTNGDIFKVKLTKTPQILTDAALGITNFSVLWENTPLYSSDLWDNDAGWEADGINYPISQIALEGQTTIIVDTSSIGNIIMPGHVLGIGDTPYMIDDISYSGNTATIDILPPLRKNVTLIDEFKTRPYFLGIISNADEIRAMYDIANQGAIQPSARIIFSEVII